MPTYIKPAEQRRREDVERLRQVESVMRERGYGTPLDAAWMRRHLDHYRMVIDAYSELKSRTCGQSSR